MWQELTGADREDLLNKVEVFHSQIPDQRQKEIASSLMTADGEITIVIATSALSMGFDAIGEPSYYILFSKNILKYIFSSHSFNILSVKPKSQASSLRHYTHDTSMRPNCKVR